MPIFEVINPSDKTTCEAPDLAVAAFSAIFVCTRYGVVNCENDEERFIEFIGAEDAFRERWGDCGTFLQNRRKDIVACLDSFAYASADERVAYKRALELIDDPVKRETYRSEWENRRRSSLNRICQVAWSLAAKFRIGVRPSASSVSSAVNPSSPNP